MAAQHVPTTQAGKAARAQELAAAFLRILALHRVDFPPAQRPVAVEPTPPDRSAIYAFYEQQLLVGIGRFQRAAKESAKAKAAEWTEIEAGRRWQSHKAQQAQWQQTYDQQGQLLCDNDLDTVLQTLAGAFEDNEAACAAIGMDGAEVSLVLVVPPASAVIPEHLPGHTAAGNVSLKKITQAAKADFYKHFVCGQILVTLREAFAVAPGLTSARLVALRNDGRDVYGHPTMPCLAAVNVTRNALNGVRWNDADAVDILNAVAREQLINQTGRSKELSPLDLTSEPDIIALIKTVDLEELATER
jgi:YD repeat-containing protein